MRPHPQPEELYRAMRLVDVRLDVTTAVARLNYNTRFSGGLNVLNAPNTWGKSTLLQSMVFVLGLEGMLSASRQAPLGEAMTRVVDSEHGRSAVVESAVTLTLQNMTGKYLRARRFAKSLDVGSTLIQTWSADSEDGLREAPQYDTFVREPGAASREAGFHRVLTDFLNWQLPAVPNFDGGETPLYLELLFPLFYVEQKFGWSGIVPRIPTYLRVREPLRRSVEYVLGLSTLERIKKRNSLREQTLEIKGLWASAVQRAREAASAHHWRVVDLPDTPTSSSQRRPARVLVRRNNEFVPLLSAVNEWSTELDAQDGEVTLAGERTLLSREQLDEAERELRRFGAAAREAQEALNLAQADSEAVTARLAVVEEDRRRLRDVRRLRALGSTLELPLLSSAQCPTCEQDLDGRLVATGQAASIEDSAILADAERLTLIELQESIGGRTRALGTVADAAGQDLAEARNRVRLLRDELSGPSAAPSYAEVERRLSLKTRLHGAEQVAGTVEAVDEELDRLAIRLDDVRIQLAALEEAAGSPEDAIVLANFRARFREQLALYGLRSLPPENVTIDERP